MNFMIHFTQVVKPDWFLPSILATLDELQTDLSVSRARSRLSWGHPAPGDDTQTIYVWLDALVNYLTVAGYPEAHTDVWQAPIHVIGEALLSIGGKNK